MAELKSRIGRKAGEKHFHNKSWVRPGFQASPSKQGTWDTSDSTSEGDSDSGSHNDDMQSSPFRPPLSLSNPSSPYIPTLLDRMETSIINERLFDPPDTTEKGKEVLRPLIERVDFGRKDDRSFVPQSEDEDGMDIDKDNDWIKFSGTSHQTYQTKNIQNSHHDSNHRVIISTVSSVTNMHSQALPLRQNDSSVSQQQGNSGSHRTSSLAERMQVGYAPPHLGPSSSSNTLSSSTKASTLDPPNKLQRSNVMPHHDIRHTESIEEGELRGPPSTDQVRVVLLPLMLQNAERRITHTELKATSPQHATVNPKVLTDEVCASFSEIGQTFRNEIESRDPPRRSPPRVDPSKAVADANLPASTSTEKRVQSSLDPSAITQSPNSSACNHNAAAVSNDSSMPTTLPPRPEDARKEAQSTTPHIYQGPSRHHTSDSQDSRDADYARRRPSESRYDGRRRSRSPRNILDNAIKYGHERRLSDREYDKSRSRPPLSPPPRTSYVPDERRYRHSPERRSRSQNRDPPPRHQYSTRGRGGYSPGRRFSCDDDHFGRSYGPYSKKRSRSPNRRRTSPPRSNDTYPSRSRSPPRRGPRTSPRGGFSNRPRSRTPPPRRSPRTPPPRRNPRTPPPRERSPRMSTGSPLSDRRPRPNERIDSRDRSADMSMSSRSLISQEPIEQSERVNTIGVDKGPHKPPNPSTEDAQAREDAESETLTQNTATQEDTEPPQKLILPCHNVPGLWFVKVALDKLGTLNCEFTIDHETALKWNIAQNKISNSVTSNENIATADKYSIQSSRRKLSLQICSFSKQLVQDVVEQLGVEQTPATIANAILSLEQTWPDQGQLIITVNPNFADKKTWLPHKLGLNNTPVHIENYVHEGDNTVQFIQLSGMSENLFALCASEKPDEPDPILPLREPGGETNFVVKVGEVAIS